MYEWMYVCVYVFGNQPKALANKADDIICMYVWMNECIYEWMYVCMIKCMNACMRCVCSCKPT